MFSELSIEDVLLDNRDVVAKRRNTAEELVQWDLLVYTGGMDETASHYNTERHASTTHRAPCLTAVLGKAERPHTVSTMEPSIRGLEPERSIIHQEHGTSSSAEHSLTVLTYKPQLHRRHTLLCMFTKADMNSDTGGITNTSSCLWKLCKVASAKGSLRPSGACAEHRSATTGSGCLLLQLRTCCLGCCGIAVQPSPSASAASCTSSAICTSTEELVIRSSPPPPVGNGCTSCLRRETASPNVERRI
ncbi:hypothetical protein MTO96_015909 [Rhipicephalus appendiculatus]